MTDASRSSISGNLFVGGRIARRYAASRPALHHHAVEWLRARVPLPVRRALDLGCGTGLSTEVLGSAAAWVVGVDPSHAMLRRARDYTAIPLVRGDGHQLPFRDRAFALVTMSSAIHWLTGRAVRESARVLEPTGWLLTYDVWFVARMRDESAFSEWMHGEMAERYPQAPKIQHSKEELARAGLRHVARGDLERWVPMDAQRLCDCLMTHSERIAAIRDGRETEEEQRSLLEAGIAPFFVARRMRDVRFGLGIDLYERVAGEAAMRQPVRRPSRRRR